MTIKAIMVYCDKPYHFLYARPDLGVRGAADLKGKRIAVTGLARPPITRRARWWSASA
jgi:ABC-type nitrate/sulfonate/bicarbonate transport system substrate-binding protein